MTTPLSSSNSGADATVARLFATPAGRADPYPIYDELRRTAPVHRPARPRLDRVR